MDRDKIKAVRLMQQYIAKHMDDATTDSVAAACGYSRAHAARMFRELTGITPSEFIRALRLTRAAETLRDSDSAVLDVALGSGFDSHDGFTRAFKRRFGIAPAQYSRETPPVRFFVPYPVDAYYILKDGVHVMANEKVSQVVTVTMVERPARKLIFLRIPKATGDYFAACEEVGCDWEGFYNSISEKFDTAAGGRLPDALQRPDMGGDAFFVEVPLDYAKPLPDGYEIAELPPCTYLYFNGAAYDDENDFCIAIGIVERAIANYPYERFGWTVSRAAPTMGMGAAAATGARSAVPVAKV